MKYKKLNHLNFFALPVWGKIVFNYNDKYFFLLYFYLYSLCNKVFSTLVTSSHIL